MSHLCTKLWHIRVVGSTKLTDYQRLAIYSSRRPTHYFRNYIHYYYFTYEFDLAYPAQLSQNIQWGTTASDARPIAEELWKKHMPHTDFHLELLYDTVTTAISGSNIKKSLEELGSLFFDLYKREVEVKHYLQALNEIIKEKGLEHYPFSEAFIEEEGLKKHEGLLWGKYSLMKRFCNIQNGEALEDNRLKDLITNYFEHETQGLCRYDYTKYVQTKISITEELGILSREGGR